MKSGTAKPDLRKYILPGDEKRWWVKGFIFGPCLAMLPIVALELVRHWVFHMLLFPKIDPNLNGWSYVFIASMGVLFVAASAFGFVVVFGHFELKRRHYRDQHGMCIHCGFDLRGSSERCPECGSVFEEKVKQP